VLEVPHERRGIEEADGGHAQTNWGQGNHVVLDYFFAAEDFFESIREANTLLLDFFPWAV
jgi:hypothetical protein